MKLKILLISFLISLPFWWTMDSLYNVLVKTPAVFRADLSQKIKAQREQKQRLNNLELEAESAIVAEITPQGNIKFLFEKNSEEPRPIASISKLMTALVVFDLKKTYSFSTDVKNLVYEMLINSNNDAAFALAESIGENGFIGLMNIYAKEIGLEDTYFLDPAGLEQNISTARELVQLTKYILDNHPQIFEITTYQIDKNTNKLLGEVPGIIGGKTGWTPEAKGCLLLILENPEGGYFVNIVLGSEHRFADMRKIINAIQ